MPVEVRLFGKPAVFDGERWTDLGHTLDDAVLCYLALEGSWVARGVMAGRFWPDSDEAAARANLRWRLHRVRARSYGGGLETTRDHVRWRVETDLARFRRAHRAGAWDDVIALVTAPLLSDTHFGCSPVAEADFARERELVHRAWREAVLAHAGAAQAQRRHGEAAALLRRVLGYDLLDEEVLQAYLHAAYLDGQREQALRAFGDFERQLRNELALAPLAQTRALVATIRQADELLGGETAAGALAANAAPDTERSTAARASETAAREGALPHYHTPFLGRHEEHERLLRLLCEEDVRLVTVLGPGGVGKSRLAAEVARDVASRHRDGVHFVDVASLDDPQRLAATIVESIAPREPVANDPETQLVELLQERDLLLVLDTFEHGMASVHVVRRIAQTAPRVRLLVTSRVRLALAAERTFEIGGLACASDGATAEEIRVCPTVRLFEAVAARAMNGFVASERDRRAIVRVCRLVGGLPLAIELAATWVRVLGCDAIAEELSVSAELLTTGDGGAGRERRHASFEQVFDTSWSLLRPDERKVFAALAVFSGGFTRDTATEVAGTGLRHLRTLIDASLVQRFDSRYVLLDVIQRLAEQRLEASGRAHEVRSRHARVFAQFLQAHEPDLNRPQQGHALMLVGRETDNLRAAWRHGIATSDVDVLTRMSRGVSSVWDLRGRFAEAATMFASAAEALEQAEASDEAALGWAWMRMREGWFRFYLGEYHAIRTVLVEAGERFEHFGETAAAGTTSFILASAALARGEIDDALGFLRDASDAFERAGDAAGLAKCENTLGMAKEALGEFTTAREHYLRSLRERERAGEPRALIVALNNVATVSLELGLLAEAEQHLAHAGRLSDSSGDAWGQAWTTHNLGELALAQGRRERARAAFEQALKGLANLGHHYATTLTRERLGELLLPHAPEEAAVELRAGLQTALAIDASPRIAQLMAWLGWLRAHVDPEAGVAAITCALRLAGNTHRPRSLSERLLRSLRITHGEHVADAGLARGATLDPRAEAEALCRWVEVAALPQRVHPLPSMDVSGA